MLTRAREIQPAPPPLQPSLSRRRRQRNPVRRIHRQRLDVAIRTMAHRQFIGFEKHWQRG